MEEAASKIELFHNLYLICLVGALICLVLAVVLFFVLHIRDVLGYLTGRQRRKSVKEMEAANALSGRLMRENSSMQHVAQEMKEDMGVRQTPTPGVRKVDSVVQNAPPNPAQAAAQQSPAQETELLRQPMQADSPPAAGAAEANETTLLGQPEHGTAAPPENGQTAMLGGGSQAAQPIGLFAIEREIIYIHTDEVI